VIDQLPLFPVQASTLAGEVDALYLFLVALTVFFGALISALLIYFAIRYRHNARVNRSRPVHHSLPLELTWSIIPLGIVMGIFVWSAVIYFHIYRAPDDAIPVNVVGKQWMWKLQHLNGRREINELHVPVGLPVKITMTSEDVIHSFYIPAFRVKADAVPGRYSSIWFKATRPGRYHLFCAEYCGTKHSGMIGSVIVMEPDDFQAWMGGPTAGMSAVAAGETLFRNLGCVTCHTGTDSGRGPSVDGLYGSSVQLEDGSAVLADDNYLRESIVEPMKKTVKGYKQIMPTFQGLVTEEGLMQIIEYIKSVGPKEAAAGPAPSVDAGGSE
jgi:cytochrome c oxidase subunit 2